MAEALAAGHVKVWLAGSFEADGPFSGLVAARSRSG